MEGNQGRGRPKKKWVDVNRGDIGGCGVNGEMK